MAFDKFLIAPLKSGLQTNFKPWLILDESFQNMRNLYTWRGSIKKRFGSNVMNSSKAAPFDQLFTRLRANIGTTDGAGAFNVIVPNFTTVGQIFSVDDNIFTIVDADPGPQAMLSTGPGAGTFDTTTRTVDIIGAAALTDVFWYPSWPVMHFATYLVSSSGTTQLFAFDTQFAYTFSYAAGWNRVVGGADLWTGDVNDAADFYWTTNYRGIGSQNYLLFITNNIVFDGFRYWDGATFVQLGTAGTTPINAAGDFIETAKIVVPFKGRLLLLNVSENIGGLSTRFSNRIRFSQIGSPVDVDSWRQDIIGKGNFITATTKESIISIEFIKDRLIIFFDSSTWELVDTGNSIFPFQLLQLNSELGVESSNSVIPFDKVALGFGQTGIHACNGVNVERIDQSIPSTIFDVRSDNFSLLRVAGVRDYYSELVYWSYTSVDASQKFSETFPNRVLVYDYINGTWAYNDDSITAFGLFSLEESFTWQDFNNEWKENQDFWDNPDLKSKFKNIVGGNQRGFTFLIDPQISSNSISLDITGIAVANNIVQFEVNDHNLAIGSYIYINSIQADAPNMADDGVLNKVIFKVDDVQSEFLFTIDVGALVITGVYTGGGVISRVSVIDLISKQYNFYNKAASQIALSRIDFLVDRQEDGQVSLTVYNSSSDIDMFEDSQNTGSNIGTGILETSPYALKPMEATQERFWHSFYLNSYGENFSYRISMFDDQIRDPNIVFSDFQLNAVIFNVMKISNLGS